MEETTWKHDINSGKAALQTLAQHLQFKLLTAVLGNKDKKSDKEPGNIFAVRTAASGQVVLHFLFSCLEENWLDCPQQEQAVEHLHSCSKQIILKIRAVGR